MKLPVLKSSRWNRSWLFGVLAAFVAAWFLFFDTHSLLTKLELQNQKKDLIERTNDYKERTAELEQKIKDLENNPNLLEKIAREDYGMRKPDETVYKIVKTE
jgi:cell division protein FtsB